MLRQNCLDKADRRELIAQLEESAMPIKDGVLREQLCHVGKLLYEKGFITGTQGNLSCRASDGQILITPKGGCKGMLQPDDIVLIGSSGMPVDPKQSPSSEYRMHLHGYQRRNDFHAAVHAHPSYATAFALGGVTLDVSELSEGRANFGEIPFISYAEPGTQDLADRLGNLVLTYHTFLLENHGIMSFGSNLMEAFFRVEMAEQIAKTIYLSRVLTDVSLLYEEGAFAGDDEDFGEDESEFHPPRGN
jgi:L-fuculose-phosphate aldolase